MACIKARQKLPFGIASVHQPGDVMDPIVARFLSCVDELGLREGAHHNRREEGPGRITDDRITVGTEIQKKERPSFKRGVGYINGAVDESNVKSVTSLKSN